MQPNDYDWMAEEAEWVFVPIEKKEEPERIEWRGFPNALLFGVGVVVLTLVAWRLAR
jgi:hypothetical protein